MASHLQTSNCFAHLTEKVPRNKTASLSFACCVRFGCGDATSGPRRLIFQSTSVTKPKPRTVTGLKITSSGLMDIGPQLMAAKLDERAAGRERRCEADHPPDLGVGI